MTEAELARKMQFAIVLFPRPNAKCMRLGLNVWLRHCTLPLDESREIWRIQRIIQNAKTNSVVRLYQITNAIKNVGILPREAREDLRGS